MIELFEHQKKAVEKARTTPHLALFFDAGTGKTGTMVRILAEDYNHAGKMRPTLIFAPICVCPQWKVEFAKFSNIPQEKIHVLTGTGKKRTEQIRKAVQEGPCIVVTNYEAVQIKAFYEELLAWCPPILILDESHRIKDSKSKRAKAIYPLAHGADRRFILTGTPVVNSLEDIFGQYKALVRETFGESVFSFRQCYFYDRNAGNPFAQWRDWQPHPWSAKEIGKKIAPTSIQAKRDDCLDLPPLQQIPVPVELSAAQRKAYNEMSKEFVTEVKGLVASSDFEMVKVLRMRQMLAGFVQPDESKEPVFFEDIPRLKALCETVESIGKERFIVWTEFKPTYRKIGDALEKTGLKIGFLTGEQTARKKVETVAAFKRGDLQGLIANPAAASEGINLQEARYALYYDRGYNLLYFLQSLARNYRSGTEKLHPSVVHTHFFARGTIDEVIAYALLYKEDVCKTVLKWARGNFALDLPSAMEQAAR